MAIGTHTRNHLFHRGISAYLLQHSLWLTQHTILVAIRPIYRYQLWRLLPLNQILQPNVWCCEIKWCYKGQILVVPLRKRPYSHIGCWKEFKGGMSTDAVEGAPSHLEATPILSPSMPTLYVLSKPILDPNDPSYALSPKSHDDPRNPLRQPKHRSHEDQKDDQ
jgi:hypothetical protein